VLSLSIFSLPICHKVPLEIRHRFVIITTSTAQAAKDRTKKAARRLELYPHHERQQQYIINTLLVTRSLFHGVTLRALRLENLLTGFFVPLGRLRKGRHRHVLPATAAPDADLPVILSLPLPPRKTTKEERKEKKKVQQSNRNKEEKREREREREREDQSNTEAFA
jgi:hypothetical protein